MIFKILLLLNIKHNIRMKAILLEVLKLVLKTISMLYTNDHFKAF